MNVQKLIFSLIFIFPTVVFSQISENFSNNTFLESENTFGTKGKFIINTENELQLSDTVAGNAYVSVASEAIDNAVWELAVKINATTSSANYVRYFLASDASDLSGSLNGFYVMIGNTDDEICLYRQNGTTRTKIIASSRNGITDNFNGKIKVTRDTDGNWQLFSKLSTEEDFISEGICRDVGVFKSHFSGIFVQYSAGNKDKYFFDDWQVSGEKYVKTKLNENDIVFSELMVKPAPAVSFLPENEYIELYNRTDKRIKLFGFSFVDNSRKYAIDNCIIQPHSYLLLCTNSKLADFENFPNITSYGSLLTLTDGGKLLWLEDCESEIITWIEYANTWYSSDFKAAGGWSLECIDLDNLSRSTNNYMASENLNGGTPGTENSVARNNPDVVNPKIEKLAISSDKSIDIFFSKTMNAELLLNTNNYEVHDLNISQIEIQKPKNNAITVYFNNDIAEKTIYKISLKNITDISGNSLETKTMRFAIPEKIDSMDVVINEVMFHSASGGEKYVELYNRSNKTLDLSVLRLSNYKGDELQGGTPISTTRTLFFADEYVLLSPNCETVCSQYTCGDDAQKINLKPFPSYPIANGDVVLVTRDGKIIDKFSYSEKMHHPMVKNPAGVSLERINPDLPNADNWHSASFECGYGTPGAKNSQFIDENEKPKNKTAWITPEVFSPDNDGNDDFLNIYYNLGKNGYTANIKIYDANGRCVKKLINNTLLSDSGVFRWNGENDSGTICNIGIYIVYIEFINTNGNVKKCKLSCVLSIN